MKMLTFISRSLWHYRRTHFAVLLGSAVAGGVLTGALMVGDAVRGSLERRVEQRLGTAAFAIVSGEHFFSAALAERLAHELKVDAAAAVSLRSVTSLPDGSARANRVNLLGIDDTFCQLAPGGPAQAAPGPGEVCLNARLAARLDAVPGDTVIIRVDKQGAVHRDTPLAPEDLAVALRLRVKAVVTAGQFGLFSLRAEQALPMNAFVAREALAERIEQTHNANLLLLGAAKGFSADRVETALTRTWQAEDAGLTMHDVCDGVPELRSRRVFIDERTLTAAHAAVRGAQTILTYFVNELRAGNKSTPYSFVAAPGADVVPPDMPDDGIVINTWLAEDLAVGQGDELSMRYFVMGPKQTLYEESRLFRVQTIRGIEGPTADPDLMPAFPGLAEADNCRDWDPGLPLDLQRVRDKDEAYWNTYRGTPKAFVTLRAAQAMWGNRYGRATAVRFPRNAGEPQALLARVLAELAPGDVGIRILPVREDGLRAGREGVDFGQLFLGLSFFLVVAALLLTGLLFAFNVEQRAEETGLLLATGFSRRRVRNLRLIEGGCIALPGALLGIGLGVACNHVVLLALTGIWRDVVGTVELGLNLRPLTAIQGFAGGAVAAWGAMWLTARRQLSRSPAELQRGMTGDAVHPRSRNAAVLGIACWVAAAAVVAGVGIAGGQETAGAFFGAGSLALIGGLCIVNAGLRRLGRQQAVASIGLVRSGIRDCARRPRQALATVAFLAVGVFLVIATGANRSGPPANLAARSSGTGGFALFAESSLPILDGLRSEEDAGLSFVPMRVFEGDDASCLNLNRVAQPPIIGVDPQELSRREAFSFATLTHDVDPADPWAMLDEMPTDGTVPAVADQSVITWGLGKSVGDTLTLVDGRGEALHIKLVAGLKNSVLQGSLVISEGQFTAHFPDEPGYRTFLVDVTAQDVGAVARGLSSSLRDYGFEVEASAGRLASFAAVQNAYLAIFLALGALGLLLGSVGMGVLVARNVLARRGELAMLGALGFSRRAIHAHLLAEHAVLLGAGLLAGALAGLVAVFPALRSAGADVSVSGLLLLLLALLINGLLWIALAVRRSLRGPLLSALREE